MNQAVFWVTPKARPSSQELIPFLAFTIIQKAGSHLSKPSALSSKIVPAFTENCFAQSRHLKIRRVDRNEAFLDWQLGQVALPSGQRIQTMNFMARSGSAKYLMACVSVSGNSMSLFMPKLSHKAYGESSI